MTQRIHHSVCGVTQVHARDSPTVRLTQHRQLQMENLAVREYDLVALTIRLLRMQEEERRRIARDLHDDPMQRMILLARAISTATTLADKQRWVQEIEDIVGTLHAICNDLRPSVLDLHGVVAGIQRLIADVQSRSDLTIQMEVSTDDGLSFGRLPADLEIAFYRITQEALHNCLKHAQATRVDVLLQRIGQQFTLLVRDNGKGISATTSREDQDQRLGMLGMRERLRPWGGIVTIANGLGGGTEVKVEVNLWDNGDDSAHNAQDSRCDC